MSTTPKNHEGEPKTKEQVIQALREKRADAQALLLEWTVAREGKVADNLDSRVEFELERAALYLDAGLREDAELSVEAAYEQAENEGRMDLAKKIYQWAQEKLGEDPPLTVDL